MIRKNQEAEKMPVPSIKALNHILVFLIVALILSLFISSGCSCTQKPPEIGDVETAADAIVSNMIGEESKDESNNDATPEFILSLEEDVDYEVLEIINHEDGSYSARIIVTGLDMRTGYTDFINNSENLFLSPEEIEQEYNRIASESPIVQTEITVPLTYSNGKYEIVVTNDLIDAMYGKLFYLILGEGTYETASASDAEN